MYYTHANLKAAAKRTVLINGEHRLTKHYIELPDYEVKSTDKAGVKVLVSSAAILSQQMIHVVYNPEIYANAEVSAQQIVAPGEFQLKVTVRPHDKEYDWDSLDWLARIYVDETNLR